MTQSKPERLDLDQAGSLRALSVLANVALGADAGFPSVERTLKLNEHSVGLLKSA